MGLVHAVVSYVVQFGENGSIRSVRKNNATSGYRSTVGVSTSSSYSHTTGSIVKPQNVDGNIERPAANKFIEIESRESETGYLQQYSDSTCLLRVAYLVGRCWLDLRIFLLVPVAILG